MRQRDRWLLVRREAEEAALGVFGDAQVAVAQVVLDAAAEVRFWERVRRDNEAEEDDTHYFFFFCFVFGMRAFFLCPVLRRAAAATQELLQRRPSRGRLCASSVLLAHKGCPCPLC
uniref:Uncharacterized protein n=1 Tax=Pelagomonas calceolata TaxID=35677 RepID=A0A7S4E895_9STRA